MFGNKEREEFEAIQREEAFRKIGAIVKRYDFSDIKTLALFANGPLFFISKITLIRPESGGWG